MKLTGAAILVSRGMKVLQAAPAAYSYHKAVSCVMPWSHRVTQIEGRPALVLVDDRFRSLAPVRELPRLVWFGVYCRLDPGRAFWHPDETEILNALELDLLRLSEQFGRGWAVYVLQIVTRGIQEYFFYCGSGAALEHLLPSLQATYPDYRIECDETADADWKRYRTFLRDHEPVA